MDTRSEEIAKYGWESNFPTFSSTQARVIRDRLEDFLPGSNVEQVRAWDESIPKLQTEVREVLEG